MKKILPGLLVLSFFVIFSPVRAADILQFCVKESGVVFVYGTGSHASDCKKNDKLLTLHIGASGSIGQVGATGVAGPTGATGTAGPSGILGPTGSTGFQGVPGETGATGPVGATGINGISGYEIVSQSDGTTADPKTINVNCPAGKKVISGGFTSSTQSVQVFEIGPTNSGSTWTVTLNKTTSASAWDMTATAICVNAL